MTVNVTEVRRQWLTELYEANSAAVFNQCRRLLKSPEDAADATQEIFLRAATSLSETVEAPQARAWLNTVARNYCIDLIRRRERLGTAMATLGATADAPGDSVESVDDRAMLLAILPKLGERERQALWQSAVEDLPLSAIARTFGISYLAAAQLLHRARRRALVLATRLAVVLGLLRFGQAARKSRWLRQTQQVAAVVAIPAVTALLIVTSAPPQHVVQAQAKTPAHAVAVAPTQPAPATGPLPATGPAPTPAKAPPPAVAAVPPAVVAPVKSAAVRTAPVKPVTPVQPSPAPAPVDRDKDHGKGRDRDDLPHPSPPHKK